MNLIGNNLWLNLTVILPGMVTYGTWRLVILLIGYKGIDFTAIDHSIVLSVSVLMAFALIQQVIGISIEAALTFFFYVKRDKWRHAYLLFAERFSGLAENKFNEDVLRTIDKFFLSLNLAVGQVLIFLFILAVQNPQGIETVNKPLWLYYTSGITIAFSVIVAIFRSWNAIKSIRIIYSDNITT
ncbi:MAG: hypothetical protein ACOY46_08485 [Bacillota bacterium]